MSYNLKIKLLIILIVGGGILYGFFRTDIRDSLFLYNRPWAHSSDKNAKLFVGTWEGVFIDPTGISKKIELTILKPSADNKGRRRFFREVFRNKGLFDGRATITSTLGVENYDIYGKLKKEDMHQFNFEVREDKNLDIPNFYFQGATNGNWIDDDLHFTTGFNYRRADGSSFWSSSEPIYDYKTTVSLKRKKAQ